MATKGDDGEPNEAYDLDSVKELREQLKTNKVYVAMTRYLESTTSKEAIEKSAALRSVIMDMKEYYVKNSVGFGFITYERPENAAMINELGDTKVPIPAVHIFYDYGKSKMGAYGPNHTHETMGGLIGEAIKKMASKRRAASPPKPPSPKATAAKPSTKP